MRSSLVACALAASSARAIKCHGIEAWGTGVDLTYGPGEKAVCDGKVFTASATVSSRPGTQDGWVAGEACDADSKPQLTCDRPTYNPAVPYTTNMNWAVYDQKLYRAEAPVDAGVTPPAAPWRYIYTCESDTTRFSNPLDCNKLMEWTATDIYSQNASVVRHNGGVYRNRGPVTAGDEPRVGNASWDYLGACDPAHPLTGRRAFWANAVAKPVAPQHNAVPFPNKPVYAAVPLPMIPAFPAMPAGQAMPAQGMMPAFPPMPAGQAMPAQGMMPAFPPMPAGQAMPAQGMMPAFPPMPAAQPMAPLDNIPRPAMIAAGAVPPFPVVQVPQGGAWPAVPMVHSH